MKATEQFSPVVLFILLYKLVGSVDDFGVALCTFFCWLAIFSINRVDVIIDL